MSHTMEQENSWDRTTIYVPNRHSFKAEIHRLRGEHEAIGDASMRETYRALFEAALENPDDVVAKLGGDD